MPRAKFRPLPLKLTNHNEEQLSEYDRDEIIDFLSYNDIIIRLFKYVHLDPDKPGYHNIYYTDIKSGNALVFKDDKWSEVAVISVCEETVDHMIELIEGFVKENEVNSIDDVRAQMVQVKEDAKTMKIAVNQMRMMLWDKRVMIRESKKRSLFDCH